MNRHVTCKHREIAAPVHVKERGGEFTTAILETKGAWRKESTPDRKRKYKGSKRKKTGLGDLILSLSQMKEKNLKIKNLT